MAVFKVDAARRRWMITPRDIMERSVLLKLPARKWMTQLNMFMIPSLPGNARAIVAAIQNNELRDVPPEMIASLDEVLKPARSDRQFPTWYAFKNDKFPPADHQIEALQRVYPVDEFALLMEMGTMKTRVMIDCVTAHFYERRIQFCIVIVPLTVKMSTWVDELANFSPCPYNFIDVDATYNAHSLKLSQDRMTWLVVGIESLSQGKTFKALEPVTKLGVPYACVVDESTRIANHKAICTQASFALRRNATIKGIATGFEVKKNLIDLYSQFEFLSPNIIGVGDYFAFRNRYCIMGGYKNKEIVGYDHSDELMGLVAPHVYQCDKSILKLPPKLYEKRIVQLTPEQKKAYQAVKKGLIERVSVENTLTKTLRMQQIANGYYNTDKWITDPDTGKKTQVPVEFVEVVKPTSNPKLRELITLAKEISHPMIVWAESIYEMNIVQAALEKLGEVIRFDGSTPKEDRNGLVKKFQTGNIPYFVGTPAAGGIGITLTAARTVTYFSNNQRLEYRVQSEDRAHRKGQRGSVTIIDLVAAGTVDAAVLQNHKEKIDLALYVKLALRDRIAMEKFYEGELDERIVAQAKAIAPEMEVHRETL